jgi:hypothetical protein
MVYRNDAATQRRGEYFEDCADDLLTAHQKD